MSTGYTEWVNPTKNTATLDLCANANAKADQPARVVFRVPPMGTKMTQDEARKHGHLLDKDGGVVATRVPSEFDNAIRKERDGKTVGGLAPFLLKLNEENPPVQPVLVPEEEQRIEAERIMREANEAAFHAETSKRAAAAQAERANAALDEAKSKATEALEIGAKTKKGSQGG